MDHWNYLGAIYGVSFYFIFVSYIIMYMYIVCKQ